MQEELFLVEMVQGHVLKIEKLSIFLSNTYIDQLEVVLYFPNQQKKTFHGNIINSMCNSCSSNIDNVYLIVIICS